MTIFAVFGLPGTGKSFLSEHISKYFNARYLSSDIIRLKIFPELRTYSPAEKKMVYFALFEELKDFIKNGQDIVIDATFSSSFYRKEIEALAEKKGIDLIWIETIAEESLVHERLESKREYSEANLEVYNKMRSEFDPMVRSHFVFNSGTENLQNFVQSLSTKISA